MRKTILLLLPLIALILIYQNCAKVKFSEAQFKSESTNDIDEVDDIVDDDIDNDDVVDDDDDSVPDVSENPSCDFASQAAIDLHGESYTENGNVLSVSVGNANIVQANGNIGSLRVDGANEVRANGNIQNVCIRAHYIEKLNGNLGSDSHITIIGQDLDNEKAKVDVINGNSNSNIVIANANVALINGNFEEIHAYNSQISLINGNGGKIHLYDGATVLSVNGNVGEIVNH